MRKLIFLFALMAFGMMASAQAWSTSTSIIAPSSGELWGAGTHDTTLTGSINTTYIIRLKSDRPMDITLQAYMAKISGTVTGNVILISGSNDGTTWNPVDSTLKLGSDATATKFVNLDDWNYSYMKLYNHGLGSSGKVKTNLWYSIRQE